MPSVRLVHRSERLEDGSGVEEGSEIGDGSGVGDGSGADGATEATADADREPTVLAADVEVARSTLEQGRGLMFRRSVPDGYALVFPFDGADTQWLHMLFVPFAIDALWLVDGEVRKRKRLAPFVGLGRGRADTVVELPAGAADGVSVGDEVRLVE